ncbi:sialoadhesin isoform X2 [Esox lucius]|uniref:sialoadhesin isoform X2 n=1 Tax=Esox lucius TaxID=8010 RepID=UPI00147720A3|nr:sialoadhesin isoform X2 [Esox lucius]
MWLHTATSIFMEKVIPKLSLNPPDGQLYSGEKVTFLCSAQGTNSSGWTYVWFKDSQEKQLKADDANQTSYHLKSAGLQDSGTYWCRATEVDRRSDISNSVSITVTEPPDPSLSVQSGWLDVFPSETVILSCSLPDKSAAWLYRWSRDGHDLTEEGATLSISSATQTDSGTYRCSTTLASRPASTKHSNTHTLTVSSNSPIASLLQAPGFEVMYTGEKVSFSCSVKQSSGWQYVWSKDSQKTQLTNNDSNQTSYTISSAGLQDSGTYWCRATRGKTPFYTQFSQAVKMEVREPPVPSLSVQSGWLDVFPSETVILSCSLPDKSAAWLYRWSRDGHDLTEEGATLSISSATQTDSGTYRCSTTLASRPASTKHSNTHTLTVSSNSPIASLLQAPGFEVMYTGEKVSFSCSVKQSSGWQYVWSKDSQKTQLTNNDSNQTSYTISSAGLQDSGTYWCRATRGKTPFYTQFSQAVKMEVREPPVPSLSVQSGWLDVFPSETVILSCSLPDKSAAWLYRWSRDGHDLTEEGATLSISSATQTDSGTYRCSTTLASRPASTKHSNTHTLTVSPNSPIASLLQAPGFEVMYTGEKVSFSCSVKQSSGWQYVWSKDSQKTQLTNNDSNQTSYTISSAGLQDSGTYWCRATRGKTPFYTQFSQAVKMEVREPPVPSLSVQSGWLDVFPSETVILSCSLPDKSAAWLYRWSRDGHDLTEEGATLSISSATQTDSGTYRCSTTLASRPASTKHSNTHTLTVSPNSPIASLLQAPGFEVMYTGEKVSFSCSVKQSSGWQYVWSKDSQKTQLTNNDSNQTSYTISSAGLQDSGTYWCRATRGKTPFYTQFSQAVKMEVREPPVPSLSVQSGWLDVFPSETVILSCSLPDKSAAWLYRWSRNGHNLTEEGATLSISSATQTDSGTYRCSTTLASRPASTKHSNTHTLTVSSNSPIASLLQAPGFEVMYTGESVSFSCSVNQSSGWQYVWSKDSQKTQLTNNDSNQTSYTISSAGLQDSGTYWCRATRGKTPFYTQFSQAVKMEVRVRPWAEITLETGWAEVFSTDSLALKCDVLGSHGNWTWNYTWYREEEQPFLALPGGQERYLVTPTNNPTQNAFRCQGNRMERPYYSTRSEPLKTKNLVLKRKVLLSISGCLFFGIIVIFLGCIFLQFTKKPVDQSKASQPDLFLSMAQLKSHTPSPLADYVTEPDNSFHNKDPDEDGGAGGSGTDICTELTPLPISRQDDQDILSEKPDMERNGGMVSFSS